MYAAVIIANSDMENKGMIRSILETFSDLDKAKNFLKSYFKTNIKIEFSLIQSFYNFVAIIDLSVMPNNLKNYWCIDQNEYIYNNKISIKNV
jgi:hypothetical protein